MNVLDRVAEAEPEVNSGDVFDHFEVVCRKCGSKKVFVKTKTKLGDGCPTCVPYDDEEKHSIKFKCLGCGSWDCKAL